MTEANTTNQPIPLIDLVAQYQTIKSDIKSAVDRVFEKQAFVLGPEVSALETEIATYCDAREAIGCASGTDALVLSLMALGIGPGDEVITSPFSFFATASSIVRVGATPVFIDIDPNTWNFDTAQLESAITDKTKAIMPVHIFGQCADMEPVWRIAVQNGLPVVEDACQAIGARYNGRSAGVLGTVGCFSFFPTKNLGGAGDGGIMTTDDADLAARLRRLRVHGDAGKYRHVEVGFNSRLDALQAAVLRVKLKSLEQWSDARRSNAQDYFQLFEHYGLNDAIAPPVVGEDQKHVFNQFTIRILNGRRDEVMQALRDRGIGCAVYYPIPLHLQECFDYLGNKKGQFPVAEQASNEVLSLPIFAELGRQRLESVVRGLSEVLGRSVANRPRILTEVKRAA